MINVTFITGNPNKAAHFAKNIGMDIEHYRADVDEIQTLNPVDLVEHKVRQAYSQLNKPVIVEDLSFEYEALGGLPGPFVKFFVDAEDGLEKMCRILDAFENRRAKAIGVFGYYDGSRLEFFKGGLAGVIAKSPSGESGFGFDKVFIPDGFNGKTAAELTDMEYARYYTTIKPFAKVREFLLALQ